MNGEDLLGSSAFGRSTKKISSKASLGIAEARAGSAGAGDAAEDIRTNLERLRERIARAAERAGRRAEDVLVGVSKTMEV